MIFKFLDPYEKEDNAYFFGRDSESILLSEMVLSTKLTVVYGASGVGKTSLVRCGLINKLPEADWDFIFVKRAGFNDINKACFFSIKDAGYTHIDENTFDANEGSSIKRVLRSVYNDLYKSFVIIFDQFEEVFTSGNEEEVKRFIITLKEILDSEIDIRVVLILRDDFFGRLEVFEQKIPNIFRNKLRLERLSPKDVETIIIKMFSKPDFQNPLIEKIASLIVSNLKHEKSGIVDLPYLQVYLEKIRLKTNNNTDIISLEIINEIGKIDNVIKQHLLEQVQKIANQKNILEEQIWGLLKKLVNKRTKIGQTFEQLLS